MCLATVLALKFLEELLRDQWRQQKDRHLLVVEMPQSSLNVGEKEVAALIQVINVLLIRSSKTLRY
jgi:hypothetical protein